MKLLKSPFLIVFFLALVVRLVFLWQMQGNPFFSLPLVDEKAYTDFARQLVDSGSLPSGPFWQAPLYQFFLTLIYFFFKEDFFNVVRLIQVLLGAVNCGLIYLVARQYLENRTVAVIAGIIAAFYAPFLFFEYQLLSPVVEIFFNLLILLCFVRYLLFRRTGVLLLAGLLIGLSAITRGSILLLVPFFLVKLFREHRFKRLRVSLGFLACIIIPIIPVTVYNYSQCREFIPLSYNAGCNFYLGNNADYEETMSISPGFAWNRFVGQPRREGIKGYNEHSNYFFKKSVEFIKGRPAQYLALLGKKALLFCNGDELMRNTYIYSFRQYSSLFALLLWKRFLAFPFGLLFPFFLLGLVLGPKLKGGKNILYYYLLILSIFAVSFFVVSRYRLPVVPVMIIFAAQGIYSLFLWFRSGNYLKLAFAFLVLALGLGVSNINSGEMTDLHDANAYCELGKYYCGQGKYAQAEELFRQTLTLAPRDSEAVYLLGTLEYSK